jgi:nucleoside-diphosphate-sugar epimerase
MAASKWTKSPLGHFFGATVARSVLAFYSGGMLDPDPRHSPVLGRDVVAFCQKIAGAAGLPRHEPARVERAWSAVTHRPATLILGATGFIGRELVRQLTDQGRPCRVLVRSSGGWALRFDSSVVEIMVGDASRPGDLRRALEGITRVAHLAKARAKTWAEYRENDVEMTRRIAESCLDGHVDRLVYASSIVALYTGKGAGTITDRTPAVPSSSWRDPYARSKSANEELLIRMHQSDRLPVVIVRPGIVLGRGGSPFHFGVAYWRRNSICQFYGDGTTPLPIILVGDVARGIIAALDLPGIDGESFNLVGAPSLTAREYIEELERFSRCRFEKFPTPIIRYYLGDLAAWVAKVVVRQPDLKRLGYREWETRTRSALFDNSRARERLKWDPVADRLEIVRRGIHDPMSEVLS